MLTNIDKETPFADEDKNEWFLDTCLQGSFNKDHPNFEPFEEEQKHFILFMFNIHCIPKMYLNDFPKYAFPNMKSVKVYSFSNKQQYGRMQRHYA
jgi:hypothetical protein